MEETEVIELEGNGRPRRPSREERRQKRINARANLLWLYLCLFEGQDKKFTQSELSEVLALGVNRLPLREAVAELEDRGLITVDRTHKPHRYELLKTETEEIEL